MLDLYLRGKAGALPAMEWKKNGNCVEHKIEEESEEAILQPMKIGDLCPERSERSGLCAAKPR